MIRSNIGAYTASGSNYPPYISINRIKETGAVQVIVRSPRKEDGSCGQDAMIEIPADEWLTIVTEAYLATPDI